MGSAFRTRPVLLAVVYVLTLAGCHKSVASTEDDAGADGGPTQLSCGLAFDINQRDDRVRISGLTPSGDKLFFAADLPEQSGVWVTDGTETGTRWLHKGQHPVADGKGSVLFTDEGMWLSDGTPDGTRQLAEVVALPERSVFHPQSDTFYYLANNEEFELELWRSDGTRDGTYELKAFGSGPTSSPPRIAGEHILFLGPDIAGEAYEGGLWSSNGTADGTAQIGSFDHVMLPYGYWTGRVDNVLLFAAEETTNTTGEELWRSDGTAAGTYLLKDIVPGPDHSFPGAFATFEGSAYFGAGGQLWRTDGTIDGTIPCVGVDVVATAVGREHLYFVAATGDGQHSFFSTQGCDDQPTLLGTESWGQVRPSLSLSYTVNDDFYFSPYIDYTWSGRRTGLWKSEGILQSTTLLVAGELGGAGWDMAEDYSSVAPCDDALFFVASEDEQGFALWRTDGTESGTRRFLDLFEGTDSSFPKAMTVLEGGRFAFSAYDGYHSDSPFIWDPDAVGSSPQFVEGVAPRSSPQAFLEIGGTVYFADFSMDNGLYRIDESGATPTAIRVSGTEELHLWPELFLSAHGSLYFTATPASGTISNHIYRLDSATGTPVRIRSDVIPSEYEDSEFAYLAADGNVYFASADEQHGLALWRTSDATSKTSMVKTLCEEDRRMGRTGPFMSAGGLLYFFSEPTSNGELGCASGLWRSDGTAEGTVYLKGISANLCGAWPCTAYASLDDVVYFLARRLDGASELWRSDGTAEGTSRMRDVIPSSRGEVAVLKDRLYFFGRTDEAEWNLWTSDGTDAGTIPLTGIPVESTKDTIMAVGDAIYFIGCDGEHGCELWTSDGTVEGTKLYFDSAPGTFGSNPGEPVVRGSRMYFSAEDPTHGRELWYCDLP